MFSKVRHKNRFDRLHHLTSDLFFSFYADMIDRKTTICFLLGSVVLNLGACAEPKPEPEIASSAGFSGYSVEYPTKLQELIERYNERTTKAREIFSSFTSFPDELSEPKWTQVLAVAERADEVGRSHAYVERMQETGYVQTFFSEEKDEISRRIAGAVKSAEKKAECECKIAAHGKAVYAFKNSANKQINKRINHRNDAHRLIERYEIQLEKKNAKALTEQADAIAEASYIVFVELPKLWAEIDRRAAEARRVSRTIDDALEAEREFVIHQETKKKEKKSSEERIAELEEARASFNVVVDEAKKIVKKGETEISAIRLEYEKAFDMLCNEISDRESGVVQ